MCASARYLRSFLFACPSKARAFPGYPAVRPDVIVLRLWKKYGQNEPTLPVSSGFPRCSEVGISPFCFYALQLTFRWFIVRGRAGPPLHMPLVDGAMYNVHAVPHNRWQQKISKPGAWSELKLDSEFLVQKTDMVGLAHPSWSKISWQHLE
jgi:hypothetical protein